MGMKRGAGGGHVHLFECLLRLCLSVNTNTIVNDLCIRAEQNLHYGINYFSFLFFACAGV